MASFLNVLLTSTYLLRFWSTHSARRVPGGNMPRQLVHRLKFISPNEILDALIGGYAIIHPVARLRPVQHLLVLQLATSQSTS
ncbi:uncharacterized protein B0T15DRAFT_258200 [Chaetomium strumarium]|uniref:Secreted protein n=1 Tax=Chaetomium strumarium TaxID=1170767 RepID=A0AAJ0GN90_9PEZI|nr:hypothetical protein B0T15DRAFT_258200 [Chaetomium strumarium]